MHIGEDGSGKDAAHRTGVDFGSRRDPSTLILKSLEGKMFVAPTKSAPAGAAIHKAPKGRAMDGQQPGRFPGSGTELTLVNVDLQNP